MNLARLILTAAVFVVFAFGTVSAQTTEFTYQGSLQNSSAPANGNFDFEFALFDSLSGGLQLGSTLTRSSVAVANGTFSVKLDFGGQFQGANRFLEIRVRQTGNPGGFQQLLPRLIITSSPYSVRSLSATNADTATTAATATNAGQLGGIAANQYVVTTDPRLSDARPPTSGSANYIQNTVFSQASSNFNISGNGTAGGTLSGNVLNSATQLNINGLRSFTVNGPYTNSPIVRLASNTFLGEAAGLNTTPNPTVTLEGGKRNTFLGSYAGSDNSTGSYNTFVGVEAGRSNTTSSRNTYFGAFAGLTNITGNSNAYFGYNAGIVSHGSQNTFVGRSPGESNTTGSDNTFLGNYAGSANTTGSNNTAIGSNASIANNNLSYATAIGSNAAALLSDSVYLGRGADTVRIPGNLNVTGSTAMDGNMTFANGGIMSIGTPSVFMTQLSAGVGTTLCRTASNQIVTCSSSLRYKTAIAPYTAGLDVINRLTPITFDWKTGGMKDVGFGAEDIATIDPRFVTFNARGEVEGVKYDRLSVAFVNAFKEQQAQIETQKQEITELRSELEALKALVCTTNAAAAVCVQKR